MPTTITQQTSLRTETGEVIHLTRQLASSGEGVVWETDHQGFLAKVYHTSTPERIAKLRVMVANPPYDPMLRQSHVSFAWPKEILSTPEGEHVGFLMPAIRDSVKLSSIYNPRLRNRKAPRFNWYYLHATSLNVASLIESIHAKGYVVGDIKPQNLLVNNRALVSVIDTDSFQILDPQSQKIYRCLVGSEGFTPPELMGKELSKVDQTELQDRYRLGVLIYLLLFGDYPFKGKWIGMGEAPNPVELARRGYWPFGSGSLIQPGPSTVPLDIVHPELQNCFHRCFTDGHEQPHLRPTATEWSQALRLSISSLKVCQVQSNHYFSRNQLHCYWCERKQRLGLDIFDIKQIQQLAKTHPKSKMAARASTARVWKMPSAAVVAANRPKPFFERYRRELAAGVAFSMAIICLVILIAPDWQRLHPQIQQILRWINQSPNTPTPQPPPQLSSVSATESATNTTDFKATSTDFSEMLSQGSITAIAISPNGDRLALARLGSMIQIWDPQTGQLFTTLAADRETITNLAITNDQELISSNRKGTVQVWNYVTPAKIRTLKPLQDQVVFNPDHPVVLSQNGKWSIMPDNDGQLVLRDLQTGKINQALNIRLNEDPIISLAPNGQYLTSIDHSGHLSLWQLPQGKLLSSTPWRFLMSGLTRSVATSADGKLIARGNWDGQVLLWNLQTGKLLKTLNSGTKSAITALAMSLDSRYVVGSSTDNLIRLWDVQSGKILHILSGHEDQIHALSFNKDGKLLVSSSADQTARVWQVSSGRLLQIFR
jgi:serine/threonine protein kinase